MRIRILFMLLCLTGNAMAQDSTLASSTVDSTLAAAPVIENYLTYSLDRATSSPSFIYMLVWALVFLLIGMSFSGFPRQLSRLSKSMKKGGSASDDLQEQADELGTWRKLFLAAALVTPIGYFVWDYVNAIGWQGHIMEWMNLVVRWIHIVFGIAWIGASFYFIFLENSLNRNREVRDELAGNLWAIHGGGFYYLEKFKVAPGKLPPKLHWFKYEAYFTWLSGFCLLVVVYYFNATSFLIDPTVLDIDSTTAILIGVGSLAVGWVIYDLMCKSKLVHNPVAFAIVGFVIATAFAYFFTQVFSARAAYIHLGALLGTCMAGNVFFGIIPAQKALVKAAKDGTPLDPSLGKMAGLRSLHNNYITLPVLFIMISNHFPSTFGNSAAWAVLAGLSLASAGFRHWFNLYEKGRNIMWLIPVSSLAIVALVIATGPPTADELNAPGEPVAFTEVYTVVQERCQTCHSASPTDDDWASPPNGVAFDTPEQLVAKADQIMQRAVITKTMPQNNKTGMTPEERDLLRRWIVQGMPQ